jgi:plasmid stabilization system protein ParE
MDRPVVMKVEWLESANRQILEIFDYYNSAANGRVAKKIVGKIVQRVRLLSRNPKGGQREWLLEDMPERFRRVIVGNYKIIYFTEGETVFISYVWDCRRNPSTLRKIAVKAEA